MVLSEVFGNAPLACRRKSLFQRKYATVKCPEVYCSVSNVSKANALLCATVAYLIA